MHLLHHQFVEMFEHIGQILGFGAAPGRHVLEQWLVAGIELDDIGNVGVDRLVIGNAGSRSIDQSDAPGAVEIE